MCDVHLGRSFRTIDSNYLGLVGVAPNITHSLVPRHYSFVSWCHLITLDVETWVRVSPLNAAGLYIPEDVSAVDNLTCIRTLQRKDNTTQMHRYVTSVNLLSGMPPNRVADRA